MTFISDGSLERLGQEPGRRVDGRRFRMLLRAAEPHEEDEWKGRLRGRRSRRPAGARSTAAR